MEKIPFCPIEHEFEKKSVREVLESMEASNYSLDICWWGIRALSTIAGSALLAQDAHSLAIFLDEGGCEALIKIMTKYSETSELIAAYGCLVVSILAWNMQELREFLGELGACELVVYAVCINVGHPEVSEYGTRAIMALAKNNISNSFKLSNAGACEVLAQVGNFGFNLRDERCMAVAVNTCTALALLAEAVNANRLHECGSSSLITELAKIHFKNEEFALAAVRAFCALGSLSAHLREDLGRSGACKLLIDIIRFHKQVKSLRLESWEAVMHLSLNPGNADKLRSAGACDLLLLSSASLMEYPLGPEICTGAILHLATYGMTAKDGRERFLRKGIRKQLQQVLYTTKASYKARENIQQLMELFVEKVGPGESILEGENARQFVSVINGSEMCEGTLPLKVEVTEEICVERH